MMRMDVTGCVLITMKNTHGLYIRKITMQRFSMIMTSMEMSLISSMWGKMESRWIGRTWVMQKYAVLTMGKGTNYPDIFIMPMENWLLARIPIAPALNMNMIRGGIGQRNVILEQMAK